MKKFLSTILIICLVLCFTACGSEKAPANETPAADNNTAQEETAEPEVEEPEEPAGPEYQTVELGETVDLDFVEMTLDTVEVAEGYEFSYTEKDGGFTITHQNSIDCSSGMKLVCFKGTFMNKSSHEVYTSNDPVFGKMDINGNVYSMEVEGWNSEEAERFSTIVAQQKVECYFYAEVPENVADEIESCTITFGFVDNLESGKYVGDITDLDHVYTLTATL